MIKTHEQLYYRLYAFKWSSYEPIKAVARMTDDKMKRCHPTVASKGEVRGGRAINHNQPSVQYMTRHEVGDIN